MCITCMTYINCYYDKDNDDDYDDAYNYSRLDQKILPMFFLCLHTEVLQIQRILLL